METPVIQLNAGHADPAPQDAGPHAGPETVEAWSGKNRNQENFPVGSWLISARLRPHIHAFYAFARNADDIADSASLAEAEKLRRLNIMEDVLLGHRAGGSPTAGRLRASLAETGVTPDHARDLLHAFRQDAMNARMRNWSDLMDYCRYSAMPVGRYVLDLHGARPEARPHSDALCAVLQVLNHLQDCAKDYIELNRTYLPRDMMAHAGATDEDLRRPAETPALRVVFAELLAKCDELNRAAAPLPALAPDRRLRIECAIICNLARHLTRQLRRQDPVATRVKLSKTDVAFSLLGAVKFAA